MNFGKELLAGYRVIDASRILVGSHAAMMCADMGAEVIKIEQRETGDETRHWGPPFRGETSTYFMSLNRNKKSITIDLKQDAGKDIFRDLIKESNVLVENFLPAKIKKLGLDYS